MRIWKENKVFEKSARSRRVLEKCGFRLEGVLREGWFREGIWYDGLRFGRFGEGVCGIGTKTLLKSKGLNNLFPWIMPAKEEEITGFNNLIKWMV